MKGVYRIDRCFHFAWFVLNAEAGSGVQGFKIQSYILPSEPTVFGGTASITLAVVRARSKPKYGSIDDIEEEELIVSYVTGFGTAVSTDTHTHLTLGRCFEWFSKCIIHL